MLLEEGNIIKIIKSISEVSLYQLLTLLECLIFFCSILLGNNSSLIFWQNDDLPIIKISMSYISPILL